MAYEAATQIANTYCDYISKLAGVMSANVVFEDGEITEIHVLADTSRTPKQIVRDVQSLFMAQFHREVDHKIVSVAQIECDMPEKERPSPRFVIESVLIAKKKQETEVEVDLSLDGKAFSGKQTVMNDPYDVYRGIAVATLSAVSKATENIHTFSVLDVRFVEMAGERMVVVCISLTPNGRRASRYSGTAFVSGDDGVATVKATLDSINRVIWHD